MYSQISATELKTEYKKDPIGIGKKPRFSWQVCSLKRGQTQLAYRLVVLDEKGDVVWDTGKIYSSKTSGIEYRGQALASGKKYLWQVCVWDQADESSAFSAFATFETGLEEEDWRAAWIGAAIEKTDGAPYLRKVFTLAQKSVKTARMYVTGLGNQVTYVNGERASDSVLEPLVTQYHKRVFYSTYDVTPLLRAGQNAIGVLLGRGYYATLPNGQDWQADKWANAVWSDNRKLRLFLRVEYVDGEIAEIGTDESWKTADSPWIFDEPYYGEAYDARKELDGWMMADYDDSAWTQAIMAKPPLGKVQPCEGVENKIVETLEPISVTVLANGATLFDMGRTISGWCEIAVKGPRGAQVKLQYSERIKKEGGVDRKGLLNDNVFCGVLREGQTDYYTLKGEGEECWQPAFTYKGFRYVEVTADEGVEIMGLRGKFVCANVEPIGEFSCSDERLNAVHELCRRALLINYHSYPSDTPVHENMGYLADGFITQDAAAYNFDVVRFYEKWATDIRLQVKPDGYIEQTAPMWDEDKENAPEWSLAIVLAPWQHYLRYGDIKLLQDNYTEMRKVFSYQLEQGEGFLFKSMWGDILYDLRRITPTVYMYHCAIVLSKISTLLEKSDAEYYEGIAQKIKTAFHTAFYDKEQGFYHERGKGFHLNAQVLPLALGLVPDGEREGLLRLVEEKTATQTCLDSGIFTLKYLFSFLTENGMGERAIEMIVNEQYKSYGYILKKGATTLWEDFTEDARSLSHHMYATVDEYFYRTLGGVQGDSAGFSAFVFKPYFAKNLQWCKAATNTIHGMVKSEWEKSEKAIKWSIIVPANTTATVYLPTEDYASVLEGDCPIENSKDVAFLRKENGYAAYAVGSGKYTFTWKNLRS